MSVLDDLSVSCLVACLFWSQYTKQSPLFHWAEVYMYYFITLIEQILLANSTYVVPEQILVVRFDP